MLQSRVMMPELSTTDDVQSRNMGTLMMIGGAEDKAGNRTILRRFVELAGNDRGCIAIIATASEIYELVSRTYDRIFRELGAGEVHILQLYNREQCADEQTLAMIGRATGIFITGGNQLKLMTILGGTLAATQIRRAYRAGCAVGGTSAGASAVCQHMMAYGMSGITPRKAMMHFAPGLGLINRLLVDQHFGARGRTGRLVTALAHNPFLLGVGLDEDTAIEVGPDRLMAVLGRGSVTVIDGGEISYNDIYRLPDKAPLSIHNIRLHLLTHGYQFDIHKRQPIMPATPPLPFEAHTYFDDEAI
jgi:cyanophycinase